jgi:hypothetical protein
MIKTMEQAYDYYDSMLDSEGLVTVAGMIFYPSDVLKKMDPTAYRCGFNDFMDSFGIDTDELEDE